MKTYRKICALVSLAIIYMLVRMNIEFTIGERIAWIIGILSYWIAFGTGEDDA